MTESVISLTEFKSNAAKYINKMKQQPQSLLLTQNGRAAAVVQDVESYQRQIDAIIMLKLIALGEADIRKGKLNKQSEVFSNIKRQLKDFSQDG